MRRSISIYIISLVAVFSLCACSSNAKATESDPAAPTASVISETESAEPEQETEDPAPSEAESAEPEQEHEESAPSEAESAEPEQEPEATDDIEGPEDSVKAKSGNPDIIWLGDSLTQGSLGDDNHNENNPQAPWRVLGEISGLNVAGAGFYGYTASDIFWAYGEYNGIKDPDITYIYWVGSNDFYQSPDNIGSVIAEIDKFNANVGITHYLVLGTTNRHDMDPNAYIGINKVFEETYGDKYLDIMPYVEYGPDGIHLTEGSYAAIARAVYEKLPSIR